MALDLVIRNGSVVDGSGAPARFADVGVAGGRIVEIGRIAERGDQEIDAEGASVTPGFVDGHTHMDAQLNWDPLGTCSSWHGVTTVVMGNCGFTLAPVRRGAEHLVVRNLERAEDLSAEAMAAGIRWRWESFAEYLDQVDELPKGINYAAQIGHSALRTWAMGERAFVQGATDDDLQQMEAEVRRALSAGAIGFSTSRSMHHAMSDGRPVASRMADWEEVRRLARVAGDHGAVFELAMEEAARGEDPHLRADFFARLVDLSVEERVRVTYGVSPSGGRERWVAQLDALDRAAERGGTMFGQSHSRGVSIIMSFETQLPFDNLPHWKELRSLPLEGQKALLRDPVVRARLIHSANHSNYGNATGADARKPDWSLLKVYDRPLPPHDLVADIGKVRGVDPVEAMIDLALEADLKLFFFATPYAVVESDLLEVMRHPRAVMTFSDSGAHVGQIVDACIQTHLLAYWALQRQAFTFEEAVRMVTHAPARAWGFADRGLLQEGRMADINIIDKQALCPGVPELAQDLPGDAKRLVIRPSGIRATIVAGEVLFDRGQHTGLYPGALIRSTSRNMN